MKLRRIFKIACGLAFVAVPPSIGVAQSVSAGATPDLVSGIWNATQQAGVFGAMLMFYMWLRSEAQRVKLQDERDALLERVLTAMIGGTEAMKDLRQLFSKQGE